MNKYIDDLVDMKVIKIYRFLDMLCIQFSNGIDKYALHIQSSWKIVDTNRKIIIAAHIDVFSEISQPDEKKETIFDKKMYEQRPIIENLKVIACNMNSVGDLKIDFSNGYVLEIFIDTSQEEECWRILKMESDEKHYVVYGKGVSFG